MIAEALLASGRHSPGYAAKSVAGVREKFVLAKRWLAGNANRVFGLRFYAVIAAGISLRFQSRTGVLSASANKWVTFYRAAVPGINAYGTYYWRRFWSLMC